MNPDRASQDRIERDEQYAVSGRAQFGGHVVTDRTAVARDGVAGTLSRRRLRRGDRHATGATTRVPVARSCTATQPLRRRAVAKSAAARMNVRPFCRVSGGSSGHSSRCAAGAAGRESTPDGTLSSADQKESDDQDSASSRSACAGRCAIAGWRAIDRRASRTAACRATPPQSRFETACSRQDSTSQVQVCPTGGSHRSCGSSSVAVRQTSTIAPTPKHVDDAGHESRAKRAGIGGGRERPQQVRELGV